MSDYRSNLAAPDLRPNFKHLHWRPMAHSFGHDVASDFTDYPPEHAFAFYQNCGLWTMDEAAILYNVAKTVQPGRCLDIGCHTGWTTAHIAAGYPMPKPHRNLRCSVGEMGCSMQTGELEHHYIDFVDPMGNQFSQRFIENCGWPGQPGWMTSTEWFREMEQWTAPPYPEYVLVCIDGDHEPGKPLEDAMNARAHLHPDGVVIFHDFIGAPVREAVVWLMDHGFQCRIYNTPHLLACTWRGEFTPPDHVADQAIDWAEIRLRCAPFSFERTV